MTKTVKKVLLTVLAMIIIASLTLLFLPINNAKAAEINGKTFNFNSNASPSEFSYIYTDSMEGLTNDKVVVTYKIEQATDAESGRIGIAWGQAYSGNSFYSASSKGCLFFAEYPTTVQTNLFFAKSLEGKYLTYVISRSTLSCPAYVSDTAPEFDESLVVVNGTDAGSFAYNMTGYSSAGELLNIYGYGSNTDILTDNKVIGVMIGEGTGKISDVKIFDENGNDLGVNTTGDFSEPFELEQPDGIALDFNSNESPSEFAYIYTDSMEGLTNDKVVVTYKIEQATDAEGGRIGIAWGQAYSGNSFYSASSKGCLFFAEYPTTVQTNLFFAKSLEGKYLTYVISRSTLSCPAYVSDTAPEFDESLVVVNGTDAGSFAYNMTGYSSAGELLNIYGYGSNTDILTDNKVIGVMIGEGTGKISDVKIFDEKGNDLGVNTTGDFYHKATVNATNGSISTDKLAHGENTITLVPEKHYTVKTFTVDGIDCTANVVDNTYTFNVEKDVAIEVEFEFDTTVFGEWIAEQPATCTATGVKAHYTCPCHAENMMLNII